MHAHAHVLSSRRISKALSFLTGHDGHACVHLHKHGHECGSQVIAPERAITSASGSDIASWTSVGTSPSLTASFCSSPAAAGGGGGGCEGRD